MSTDSVHILLVEDDAGHVGLIRRAFKSRPQPVDLTVAGSLREAQEYLDNQNPDLLVADLRLPDGSGTQLLPSEWDKRAFPVIVMTSYGDEQAAVNAMKAGALDYVVKSNTTLGDMPRIVERALREWEHISERKRAEAELAKHRDHLEEIVEERTSQLAKTNQTLLQEIADRKKAEQALREERRLLKQMLDLQEQERKLVAYEIHDGLAQHLTGALLQLQTASQMPDRNSEKANTLLETGMNLLSESVDEARRLIGGLRPPILDELGIVAAVEYLVCEQEKHIGPKIEFTHDPAMDSLSPMLKTSVFRIVQETINNARKHSQTETLRVELSLGDNNVRIEVRDWGIGFDPANIAKGHHGLQGIRERARVLGGHATIDSTPGQGTRIVVELPIIESEVE